MSDLTGKFGSFEEQITAQHTELMEALNTIAFALGAPPIGPLTTLDDVVTAITQSNTILAGIRSDNVTFHSAMLELAGLINTNTDTIINNNSLNSQRTIAAIYATFCGCATTAPILSPPLDVTPTTLVNDAKCRRIQFYLHVFGSWLTKIANYGSSASFITGDTLGTLLSLAATEAGIVATGAEVGAAAGPPGIVIGAIVGLIVGAIFTFGGSVLVDYANQFNATTFQHTLLIALYNANSADEGYAAFTAAINAEFSTIPAGILNAMFWYEWSNDIYSALPVVDDSAFDGSICAPAIDPTCVELTSVAGTTSLGFSGQVISYAIPGATLVSSFFASGSTNTTTPDFYVAGDYAGWTMRILSGDHIGVQYHDSAGPSTDAPWIAASLTIPYTFPTTGAVVIYSTDSTPFTIRLCPPGVDNPE